MKKTGAPLGPQPSKKISPADHLPDYVSPARVKGLLGNVDIWRDAWGIPHVRGGPSQDAFAGLGFAQAQDRLWQMEALLRRGTPRYAPGLRPPPPRAAPPSPPTDRAPARPPPRCR